MLLTRLKPLKRVFERVSSRQWFLVVHGYEPALEHDIESRFAIGNGFLGVRGSLLQPTRASRPRTYIAGLFDASGADHPVPSLVSAPNWLRIRLYIDGTELSLEGGRTIEHFRALDFRRGLFLSTFQQRLEDGTTVWVEDLRFAALSNRAAAVQVCTVETNRPCQLELEVGLEPTPYPLQLAGSVNGTTSFVLGKRPRVLGVASSSCLAVNGVRMRRVGKEPERVRWSWRGGNGQTACLSRIVVFATGKSGEAAADRTHAIQPRVSGDVQRLWRGHIRAWRQRWLESDVAIDGDDASQQALRFAIYHLISAANPDDERVSVGARALTGDAYKGHVFWDTEIFLLPFYTLTWPAAARAMLMYRYHTLPAARAKAATLGYRGALYAWESADTGEETTPAFALGPQGQVISIRCGVTEHHISADIAYAVWQYWQATRDTRFLLEAGAEVLLETSRFWASRARLDDDGSFHIRGVIGPDEYHEDIDDNAYTNVMAAFNLECGRKTAALLQRRWPARWEALRQRLELTDDELALWRDVEERLATGFEPETGRFEQFAGFFSLEDIDLGAYTTRTAPMDVMLGQERTARSQVIKQADVVMLLALLPDRFGPDVHRANFRYYEPRTGHGSSLSPPAHATVAARMGDIGLAKRLFDQTAAIDLEDTMGTAAGGVHIGALGGLWQAAVFGFAGLRLDDSGPRLDPHPPPGWRGVRFAVRWRGRRLRVDVTGEPLRASMTLEIGAPISVGVGTLHFRLRRRETVWCELRPDGEWQEVT